MNSIEQKYHQKYNRDRYYRLKEQGICVLCGKEKAVEGRTKCKSCADFENKKIKFNHQVAIHAGVCTECGRKLEDNNYKTCERCRRIRRKKSKEWRNNNKKSYNHKLIEYIEKGNLDKDDLISKINSGYFSTK